MDRPLAIVILHTLNVLFDILGMLLFGAVVVATVKQKGLHGPCHLLIGAYSLCGFCSKSVTILPYFLTMLPPSIGFLPFYACAIFHLISFPLMYGIFPLMLSIGFDRLLSIFYPIWYTTRSTKIANKYLAILLFHSSFFPLFIAYGIVANAIGQPNKLSKCTPMVQQNPNHHIMIAYIGLTFFCYMLILVKMFLKRSQEQFASIRQAIFKSLALVILVQICCWLLVVLGLPLILKTDDNWSQEQLAIRGYSLNCFASLFTTSEMPILYFTSSDHRSALRKQFPRFFHLFPKLNNNTVGAATVNVLLDLSKALPRLSSSPINIQQKGNPSTPKMNHIIGSNQNYYDN